MGASASRREIHALVYKDRQFGPDRRTRFCELKEKPGLPLGLGVSDRWWTGLPFCSPTGSSVITRQGSLSWVRIVLLGSASKASVSYVNCWQKP